MKLIKLADGQLVQAKEVPGLLSCHIDYEVKKGTGKLDYIGPKFTPDLWHQVLSFFRWTHKEMDSESQVRLYVNTKLGRWGAWAFPQEARTGMSAREIATPESPEQAVARFASWGAEPSGDWFYFCTVHHHCSASAFQSSTDEANERNQDGLHITVGRMDTERHDLHARFYLNENCFEPDLNAFWPIPTELAEQVPPALLPELARFQMGEKVVVDFPDQWRKNVIEVLADGHHAHGHRGQLTDGHQLTLERGRWEPTALEVPDWLRAEHALRELSTRCGASSLTEEDMQEGLHYLVESVAENPAFTLILLTCVKHQVLPEDLLEQMRGYEAAF